MSAVCHVKQLSHPLTPSLEHALNHVDALLDRFYRQTASHRSLHPLEAIRLMHDGAVLGGGYTAFPDDLALLDRVITAAYIDTRAFIDVWYRDSSSVQQKADRLGISRTDIYKAWKQHLGYLAGALRTHGAHLGP